MKGFLQKNTEPKILKEFRVENMKILKQVMN